MKTFIAAVVMAAALSRAQACLIATVTPVPVAVWGIGSGC